MIDAPLDPSTGEPRIRPQVTYPPASGVDNTLDAFDDRASRLLDDNPTVVYADFDPHKLRDPSNPLWADEPIKTRVLPRRDIQAMLERSRREFREGFKP